MNVNDLVAEAVRAVKDPSVPAERLAGLALELSSIWGKVDKSLDGLKDRLRAIAKTRDLEFISGEFCTIFDGVDREGDPVGTVKVAFPEKQVKLAKGVDIEDLKSRLGSDFDLYFETKVTHVPRKELPGLLRTSSEPLEDKISTVLSVLEYVDSTPRVGFKPNIGG